MPQATPAVVVTSGGGSVDNTLPGQLPSIDNSLPVPPPPPGIWPPPSGARPIQPLPPGHPMPPGSIWPPVYPVDPGYGQGRPMPPHVGGGPIDRPGTPGSPPERPEQGLPPMAGNLPSREKHLVAIVDIAQGGGMRVIGYTVVDPSINPIDPGYGRPGGGSRPDNTLPPTAEPKR